MSTDEEARRLRKVLLLVDVLDQTLAEVGYDIGDGPFCARALLELSDDGWSKAALIAGITPPSGRTRDQVVAVFAARRSKPFGRVRS